MVLLLGATGLLGHNVLKTLLESGHDVRAIVRNGSNYISYDGDRDSFETFEGDILKEEDLLSAADGCDAIINCAGTTDMSLHCLDEFKPVNTLLPAMLTQVMERKGITTLIHTSTANTIKPGTREAPSNETAPFAPPFDRSYYAESKLLGEKLLLEYSLAHPRQKVVIVNPGFLVGPYDVKPSSGKLLLAGYRKALMAAPDGGKSFVAAKDVAAAIVNALAQGSSGRYLLTGKSMTLKEFYALEAKVSGYKQLFITLPSWLVKAAGRVGDMLRSQGHQTMLCSANVEQLMTEEWYDCSKAVRELAFPQTPVEDAVEEFFNWRAKHLTE